MIDTKNLTALNEEFDAYKKEFAEKVKAELFKTSQQLFDAYPKLKSFGWTQYTPYWQDGDTCEFSVNTYTAIINGFNPDSDEEPEEEELQDIEELESAEPDIKVLLESLNDEAMLIAFGDHVTVTIHRDGRATTEEYEHD